MTKFPFEVVAVVLLLGCTILIIADTQISKEAIDPCDKPQFCSPNTTVPNPENCTCYYECVTGSWMNRPCPGGTQFDIVTLKCIDSGQATCQPECPPFTGSTTERVTLQPGTCEEIQPCEENQKYPDRSSCYTYYLCTGGRLVYQTCPPGTVFDIYVANCITPDSNFDCYYRCVTPAPTTDVPVTVTSGSTTEWTTTGFFTSDSSTSSSSTSVSIPPTTTNPGGSGSDTWTTTGYVTSGSSISGSSTSGSSTSGSSTSGSSTSVSISSTTTNTDGSGSGNEAVLIGIIIGVLVLIILIVIIIIVVCMKKHRKNKVDPENCCSSFFHRVHLYVVTGKSVKKREQARRITVKDVHLMGVVTTVSVDHSNPILLSPVLLAAGDPERTNDFDHSAFITKAEKEKRKGLKRYKRIDPSREEAIKAAKKYKKKLRKDLHLRYEAEEKHENAYYNDKVDLLNNDALAKRQKFRSDLRSASDRNDPTQLTALANNHVNSQHANTNARQEVLNGRDEMLRTRLKDMHLTQTDMLTAGLLASDLDGSDVAMRIRKFNKQQEKMKESYLQEFTSKANSGASLADLEKLTESYESQMATLQENHLQERNHASQRLLKAIDVMALQKLDKLWEQECQKVDQAFDYSATSDADPSLVKVTLTEHLEALKKAGENIDSHITNRNLSAAVVAATNLEHGSETSTSLPNGHVTMETAAATQPLPVVPLPAETIANRNDDAWELPDAAGVNGIGGRSMAQTSESLAEEQRRILTLHQQQVEQIQAMRTREKSKMDELLMKKLSERRTGAGVSSADM